MAKPLREKLRVTLGWIAFARNAKPRVTFDEVAPPAPPDYADLRHWAAHPQAKSKVSFTPLGSGLEDGQAEAAADVFFIHPTSYFGRRVWNAPLGHVRANEMVNEVIIPAQASVFNGCCRVFAPRYRQATFYTFIEGSPHGRRALELAYTDVERAFAFYLEHHNDGRPFFLASHSQGTVHAIRLLESVIDGSPIAERMVAAYAIGFRFPLDKFGKALSTLKPSTHPTDNGTIIAWDAYAVDGIPAHRLDRAEHWYATPNGTGHWERRAHKKPLGINPLTWTQDTDLAPREKNLGAVHVRLANHKVDWLSTDEDTPIGLDAIGLSRPFVHEVSAQRRDDGFLYISRPQAPSFTGMVMPGGNYHNYDYALFHMNLRQNIGERLNAFLR